MLISREAIDRAFEREQERRFHGVLLRPEHAAYAGLDTGWHDLLEQVDALMPSRPWIRVRPLTLCLELDDLLAEWRELWVLEWFGRELHQSVTSEWTLGEILARVASWAREIRIQAEILATETGTARRISLESTRERKSGNGGVAAWHHRRSLDSLTGKVERETARLQDLLFEVEPPAVFAERSIGIAFGSDPEVHWTRSIAELVELRCSRDRFQIDRIREWRRDRFAGAS